MLRNVMSIAFLTTLVAVTPLAFSADADDKKCEKGPSKTSTQCAQGQCAEHACTGEKCASSKTTEVACAQKKCGTCEAKASHPLVNRFTTVSTALSAIAKAACCEGKPCCAGEEANDSQVCCSDSKTCCALTELASKKACCSDNKTCCAVADSADAATCCSSNKTCCAAAEFVSKKTCCSDSKTCCAVADSADSGTCCSSNKTCCADADVASADDPCTGCPGCSDELIVEASTTRDCQCGDGCGCCDQEAQEHRQQLIALQWKLMEQGAKNAVLAAQLKHSEALAEAHVEFAKQLLQKEVENVHLETELELAHVRHEAHQEIAGTEFEFSRVKESLELVRKHNDQLKLELAKRASAHAEALAAFKAANTGLATRVAELENRLESINVRLAAKPAATTVK